jgi:hypothetical protein
MKQRRRKHLIMSRMANPPWDHDNPKMWFTHKIKPCRVYSYGCADCNAVLFKRLFNRFPYNIDEFDAFNAKQEAHMETGVYEAPWSIWKGDQA